MSETANTAFATPGSPKDGSDSTSIGGRGIRLENVTKRYPGQRTPAVDGLTLEIPAGKIVMLVGPSGCGKTTTLKMINRLIEPTSGRIVIGDEDVTGIDGDQLRRRIGYVIQSGGLFPHMTVEKNIGLVPRLMGWDRARIRERVSELLELVSLDPEVYRDRYPRELSGGQQQRVGVARALAGDPPVLLMDEPFGAVDPITRTRLQNELIRIQHEVRKTMVIVTHDFDEAAKLGDWIVVFTEGGHIEQYDTPERILAEPANEFVERFMGSASGLKQLSLRRVRDVELQDAVTVRAGDPAPQALAAAREAGHGHVVVLDRRDRPMAWMSIRELERLGDRSIGTEPDDSLPVVGLSATLNDALDTMLVSSAGAALVSGRRDRFEGVIDVDTVMDAIRALRESSGYDGDRPIGLNTGSMGTIPSGAGRTDHTAATPEDGAS